MRRRPSTSRSTLAAAVLAAFAALAAPSTDIRAAGLGRLTVQSALGQPLRAEVEVTSLSAQESQSLAARLASPEAFAQAGLQFSPALTGIRLAIEPRDGRTFIRVTSPQPLNEPFVDLLIELSWNGGKLLREYTFLLDPPAVASPSPSTSPSPSPGASAPATPPAATRPAPAASAGASASGAGAPAARATPQAAGRSADSGRTEPAASQVDVRRGDTLSGIAGRVKPAEVNLDQAMMAIYKANPTAFAGNMNLLRSGASLAIPDASSMASLAPDEARTQVRMQTADFSKYRRQLAGAAPAVASGESGAAASGSVTGRVQEGKAPAQGADRLRLSRPESTGAAAAGSAAVGRTGSQSNSAEQAVARDAALRESQSRVDALERNVDDLKKLLELRNRAMADLQTQLDDARAASKSVSGSVTAPGAASPTTAPPAAPATTPAPSAPATTPPAAAGAQPGVSGGAAGSAAGAAPVDQAAATPAAAPSAAEPAAAAATAAESAKDDAAPKAPEPAATAAKPAAPPVPVAQPDFLDELLENPLLLPALGGLAALGGGYALYAIRRRRRVERFEDSLIAADALAPNSLFGTTGGQSVDTRQVDLPADGPATQIQATEVDPIEEANVYVAYGREAQAEDILREGMKRNPERHAIRHRLLELYAARSDRPAFEALARELLAMTEGQGEDWDKASELGRSIDPDNPLYAAADTSLGNGSRTLNVPDLDFRADTPLTGQSAAQPLQVDRPDDGLGALTRPGGLSVAASEARPDLEIPSLDLTLDLPASMDSAGSSSGKAGASADKGSDSLLARVPDLPDSLDLDLDLAALEAISRIDTPAQPPTTPSTMADLGLDLDLDGGLNPGQGSAGEPAGSDSPRWQEMATKLDLASAYEEIGDKEGARELLQEVVAGGDAQQQAKAREMLAKLA